MIEQLLANLNLRDQNHKTLLMEKARFVLDINLRFIEKYGNELFPHGVAMNGPVSRLNSIVVEAKSFRLDTKVEIDMSASLPDFDVIIDNTVDSIYEEYKSIPNVIIPYIPVISSGWITSSQNGSAVLHFMTR